MMPLRPPTNDLAFAVLRAVRVWWPAMVGMILAKVTIGVAIIVGLMLRAWLH